MTIRDDEKFTQNIKDIVDGVGHVVDSVGSIIGNLRSKPAKKDEHDMGRKHDDDDDGGIGPTHTTGAALRVGIEGDRLLIQICESDGRVIKQVRLTKEEGEKHVRDVQKKLKALEDD